MLKINEICSLKSINKYIHTYQMPNYFVGNKLVLKITVLTFEYKYNGSLKKLYWVLFQVKSSKKRLNLKGHSVCIAL